MEILIKQNLETGFLCRAIYGVLRTAEREKSKQNKQKNQKRAQRKFLTSVFLYGPKWERKSGESKPWPRERALQACESKARKSSDAGFGRWPSSGVGSVTLRFLARNDTVSQDGRGACSRKGKLEKRQQQTLERHNRCCHSFHLSRRKTSQKARSSGSCFFRAKPASASCVPLPL